MGDVWGYKGISNYKTKAWLSGKFLQYVGARWILQDKEPGKGILNLAELSLKNRIKINFQFYEVITLLIQWLKK